MRGAGNRCAEDQRSIIHHLGSCMHLQRGGEVLSKQSGKATSRRMAMTAGNRAHERMAFRPNTCKATVCRVGRGKRDNGNESLKLKGSTAAVC